jgi:hypothetical protein
MLNVVQHSRHLGAVPVLFPFAMEAYLENARAAGAVYAIEPITPVRPDPPREVGSERGVRCDGVGHRDAIDSNEEVLRIHVGRIAAPSAQAEH